MSYSKLKKIEDNEEFHAWLKGEKSYKPNADSKAITIDLIDKYNPDNNTCKSANCLMKTEKSTF